MTWQKHLHVWSMGCLLGVFQDLLQALLQNGPIYSDIS